METEMPKTETVTETPASPLLDAATAYRVAPATVAKWVESQTPEHADRMRKNLAPRMAADSLTFPKWWTDKNPETTKTPTGVAISEHYKMPNQTCANYLRFGLIVLTHEMSETVADEVFSVIMRNGQDADAPKPTAHDIRYVADNPTADPVSALKDRALASAAAKGPKTPKPKPEPTPVLAPEVSDEAARVDYAASILAIGTRAMSDEDADIDALRIAVETLLADITRFAEMAEAV
jgi:hypothetical protein